MPTTVINQEWESSLLLLGISPLWIGWYCGMCLGAEVLTAMQKAKYEKDFRYIPHMLMAIQSVMVTASIACSFVLFHLGLWVMDAPVDVNGGLLLLSIPAGALIFIGLYGFQRSFSNCITLEGVLVAEWGKIKHPLLVGSSLSITIGAIIIYVVTFFACTIKDVDRTIAGASFFLGALLCWVVCHSSLLLLGFLPDAVKMACASLAATGGCFLLAFLVTNSTEYTYPYPPDAMFSRPYWRHFLLINVVLAVHTVVVTLCMVLSSLVGHYGFHNSYGVGLGIGVSVGTGMHLQGAGDPLQATPILLCLCLFAAYMVTLSGLGEHIPYGLVAGFGYATALRIKHGAVALGTGLGFAALLTVLLHVLVWLTWMALKKMVAMEKESKSNTKQKEE
eukprot:TRINITY_DN27146_c0_g1_i1.p1 TRINITY_DN27146_c0_g1~~TRINITY_DN27146_c0_g1_i1.p1  ORF type:complete len:391 (+),score=139.75 TRINITY_DN27146_c0_g1_i1:78-1250(+)